MPVKARFVHTNLVAKDWEALALFYQRVFGCVKVPPERHFRGTDLERGTGVKGAKLDGIHLRLPGNGASGPTLEIFTYGTLRKRPPAAVDRPGYGHIGFEVDDVGAARDDVIRAGGAAVGEIVVLPVAHAKVTWCYVADPEGNIIELQSWANNGT